MIEFPTVTKEIRSLISRRQELNTFLGSVFVATGIFLQNGLGGNLPSSLADIEVHLFGFYAVMLMVPSLILALRIARLHGGMVLNGVLYARLMQDQDFTTKGNVERAAAHNVFGVSFLQFLLADFIAAFSASVMALSLGGPGRAALSAGAAVFLVWLALYFQFHRRSVSIARRMIATEACGSASREDWEAHVSASLHDANHELIGIIGFVGLITFSVFEVISGLGQIKTNHLPVLQANHIRLYGPGAYTLLMLVTCLMGVLTYLRVRVAVGRFSLELDPNDRPFRPLVLTDSLLGYFLLAFFLAVSVHLSLVQLALGLEMATVLVIDIATLAIAVVTEQATLVVAGRFYRKAMPPTRALPVTAEAIVPSAPARPPGSPDHRPEPHVPSEETTVAVHQAGSPQQSSTHEGGRE
jgi:hypothetical protein